MTSEQDIDMADSTQDPRTVGADADGVQDNNNDNGPLDTGITSPSETSEPKDDTLTSSDTLTSTQGSCSLRSCYAPDVGCLDGNTSYDECDDWNGATEERDTEISGRRPAWTGRSLGATDLEVVAAHRRPRLVAVVGAHNAGKTTALATYFLAIRKGYRPVDDRFAGSFTLLGWHAITRHFDFPTSGSRSFPPHTSSAANRSPALLHLRLATQAGRHRDLLFTDVPGEWFEEWAVDISAVEGAQWIAERADLFVVMSDSDALSGNKRGLALNNYRMLASRVGSTADGRPVIPVRAKADIDVPSNIAERLQDVDNRLFGSEARPLSVLAKRGSVPLLEALDEAIKLALAPRHISPREHPRYRDPFLDFSSPRMVAA